jgi:hypothetical protein
MPDTDALIARETGIFHGKIKDLILCSPLPLSGQPTVGQVNRQEVVLQKEAKKRDAMGS